MVAGIGPGAAFEFTPAPFGVFGCIPLPVGGVAALVPLEAIVELGGLCCIEAGSIGARKFAEGSSFGRGELVMP